VELLVEELEVASIERLDEALDRLPVVARSLL
jgi:hypothetical protein